MNTSQNTPPDALGELTAAVEAALDQGLPCIVELYQITASGRVPVAKLDGDKFDAFALGVPAGKYMARAKVNGKYARSATIIIDGPQSVAAAEPIPAPRSGEMSSTQLMAMMMQQSQQSAQQVQAMMQQSQAQMMSLFTSSQQQMTTLLTTVLSNRSEDKSKVSEIVEAMGQIQALAPGGDKSELAEIAEIFGPIIAAAAAKGGADTVTLSREQMQKIRTKLAAKRAASVPALPAAKPAPKPTATVETKHVVNAPKQTLVEAKPGEPAAQSLPVWVPEIGRKAVEKLRDCYKIGISAGAAGTALFDLLETTPEGAQFVGGITQANAADFVATLGASVPEFATSIGATYATEAIEELQAQVRDALEEEMGLNDETDEVNDEAEKADTQAA